MEYPSPGTLKEDERRILFVIFHFIFTAFLEDDLKKATDDHSVSSQEGDHESCCNVFVPML